MSRRGKKMAFTEKLTMIDQVKAGQTDDQIAQRSGWSKWTIRKWRRAYQDRGERGLTTQMGRPQNGTLSSFPDAVRADLKSMRDEHPGWGPITLLEELVQRPDYWGKALPSRARVAAFVKEQGQVRPYQRHGGVHNPELIPAIHPHERWEMDAQGRQKVDGLGQVILVNIMDVKSHLKVASYPALYRSGMHWQDYQLVLRQAFLEFGLPLQISLDHDSVFIDNTCNSPFPSRLHLWLVGLGVEVYFIEKPPPREHAHIERNHQTMSAQAVYGRTWEQLSDLNAELNARRKFLNQIYPSRTLAYRAPLEAFPDAAHSGRPYRPEWEHNLIDMQRVYALLANATWIRETNRYGELFISMQRYNTGMDWKSSSVLCTFDPATLELVCRKAGTGLVKRFPIQRLSKADLMGELSYLKRLSAYQLALPFSVEDWRILATTQLTRGTTL